LTQLLIDLLWGKTADMAMFLSYSFLLTHLHLLSISSLLYLPDAPVVKLDVAVPQTSVLYIPELGQLSIVTRLWAM